MLYNTECFNKFVEMIEFAEGLALVEGRDFVVDTNGVIGWTGEYHAELTRDSYEFEKSFVRNNNGI